MSFEANRYCKLRTSQQTCDSQTCPSPSQSPSSPFPQLLMLKTQHSYLISLLPNTCILYLIHSSEPVSTTFKLTQNLAVPHHLYQYHHFLSTWLLQYPSSFSPSFCPLPDKGQNELLKIYLRSRHFCCSKHPCFELDAPSCSAGLAGSPALWSRCSLHSFCFGRLDRRCSLKHAEHSPILGPFSRELSPPRYLHGLLSQFTQLSALNMTLS